MGPRITCITATCERPKLLERAIKSVDNQTYKNWEHIIVNDGEHKPTREMVEKHKDERRKFIEIKHSGSDAKPKNTAIKIAKGEYICYLDDDNEYLPNFMESLLAEIEIGEEDVVYGDMRIFKDEKDREGDKAIAIDFNAQLILHRSFVDCGMALHRKSAVEQIGGWDETLPRFKDWNLFVRMMKAGLKFRRVPIFLTRYYITKGNSAEKHPVKTWTDKETGLDMFDPTWWNPVTCYIHGKWLGDNPREQSPKVAIFTITYGRLDYTKRTIKSLEDSTAVPYHHFIYDNGSTDETEEWLDIEFLGPNFKSLEKLKEVPEKGKWYHNAGNHVYLSADNKGITIASNGCIDEIMKGDYQIVIKIDNDVEFLTKRWLEDFIDLWKRNHMLYLASYPEGLRDNPGGALRVGNSTLGDEYIEVPRHVSGLCAFVDAKAYKDFRWTDQFLHGNQDMEANNAFMKQGYMPCIVPCHRVRHMDSTVGQQKKYKEYFERRKEEKRQTYEANTN